MTAKFALAIAAAALCVAGAAQAEEFQPKAKGGIVLDVRVTDVAPSGTDPITTTAGAPTGLRSKVKYDVMPTIGLSYFLSDNLALDLTLGTTKHKINAKGPGVNVRVKDTWVLPPTLTLQYHFAPKSRISPYVGAGVNYMLFYSGSDKNGFNLKVDDGFGAALQAGVDIATKDRWTVNLDAKKIFFHTDATDAVKGLKSRVTLDPWVVSAGVGYRF